ncbi:hypothetical protein HU200_042961 [Digitaria exilis]|uniref:Uncharacterized protein n=1 Tax=Digitaria exilis TaxID=1010633 RepID=A0A835B6H5_9POAL|nr:hypothetical protein HU200_042961 [Digitaria exilis]
MIPRDLLLRIARRLEPSPKDIASMKMTSTWWCEALSLTGPLHSRSCSLAEATASHDPCLLAENLQPRRVHDHDVTPARFSSPPCPQNEEAQARFSSPPCALPQTEEAQARFSSPPCALPQTEEAQASLDRSEKVNLHLLTLPPHHSCHIDGMGCLPFDTSPPKEGIKKPLWNQGLASAHSSMKQHTSGNASLAKGPCSRDGIGPRAVVARNLPHDLMITIAQKVLISGSRAEVGKMRLVCKDWSKVFEIAGPLLVVCRHPPSVPLITLMKIVRHENAPPAMEKVYSLHLPPSDSICWGAVDGMVALRIVNTNHLLLKCLTCGQCSEMPAVHDDLVPKGVFRRNGDPVLALMNHPNHMDHMVIVNGIPLGNDMTLLYIRQIDDDDLVHEAEDDEGVLEGDHVENNQNIGLNWVWDQYPGAQGYFPMRSIHFFENVSFAGVTQGNLLILDELDRGLDEDMATLAAPIVEDGIMIPWMRNGQHLFVCEDREYHCILFRSILDIDHVQVMCFCVETNEENDHELQ